MLKFFTNFSLILFILGILLIGLSFFVNVSIWYGIEIAKGSFYVLILGMFFQLMEHDFGKEKNENKQKA